MDVSAEGAPKSKILIADGSRHLLDRLFPPLADRGHEVQGVFSDAALRSVAGAVPLDLAIVDDSLVGGDGCGLCRCLKAERALRTVPVMIVGDRSLVPRQVFEAGGADYLIDPFDPVEALARVNQQLALRGLQKKLLQQQSLRLLQSRGGTPLLADLQRRLHRNAQELRQKHALLEQEVRDRRQAEAALRAEQEKSERLLLNVLPRAIVDRLKHYEGSIAERFDETTIAFADIVDFTPLAAEVPPLKLVDLLNRVFSTFDRLAAEYGLEKIKTIGDAYMVVGGIPIPRSDHAEAVMEMAIAMRREIKQFRGGSGRPLRLRIGINTGTVVAGVIGIKKFTYDLWGDAVNVASRMESQGLPGKIQVTESTYEILKDKYSFEKWGHVNIKGKGRMTTYLLVGRK